jgi:acyl carrier protein
MGISASWLLIDVYTQSETGYICDSPGILPILGGSPPAAARLPIASNPRTDSFCPEEFHVSVEEKVVGIVSEQLSVPKEEISRASSFVDDLKADSLDVVELVMEFEDEFEITIPDDDYEKIRTVGDAIDYIEEKS